MDVSVENTGGLGRRMTVKVPAERVDQEVQSRLQSMSRTVRLDGFRPGKVPLKVVEQKYGEQVRLEVVNQVVHSTIQEALTQENLRPAGEPHVEPGESRPGEPLEYVATFEVFPELAGSLNFGFTINKPAVDISDNDVDAMIENLRKQRATWNVVERAAQHNDQVNIDFEGTVDDGKPFTGNKGEKMPIVLGSNSMVPGFEEQLAGVSAGEEKTVEVTFPENYPSTDIAGKTAQFKVKVHSVSEMALPDLDDAFARAFGVDEKGIAGLREEVTANMQRELKGLLVARMKEEVFGKLLEQNPVEVPRNLIDSEIEHLKTQEGMQGFDAQTLEANAQKRIKLGVLVSEIARQNQIQVDPDRVRGTIETIAGSYEKPEEVVQWYYGNQEMLAGVQSAVMEEQVVDWVMAHSGAEVKEEDMSFQALVDAAKQAKEQG
jgi:trigger factor